MAAAAASPAVPISEVLALLSPRVAEAAATPGGCAVRAERRRRRHARGVVPAEARGEGMESPPGIPEAPPAPPATPSTRPPAFAGSSGASFTMSKSELRRLRLFMLFWRMKYFARATRLASACATARGAGRCRASHPDGRNRKPKAGTSSKETRASRARAVGTTGSAAEGRKGDAAVRAAARLATEKKSSTEPCYILTDLQAAAPPVASLSSTAQRDAHERRSVPPGCAEDNEASGVAVPARYPPRGTPATRPGPISSRARARGRSRRACARGVGSRARAGKRHGNRD